MNRINNTDAGVARRARLTNELVNNERKWLLPSGRGVQRKIKRRINPLASWIATGALLFSPCVPVHGILRKRDIDFSNYDVPLYEQIVNRIKAKVAARLGEGVNTQDRYFIIPFAYQDRWIKPQLSHSFISVIRVLGDGKQPSLTSGFRRGRYKNWNFEAFTISWVPHDFDTNPHLCVFDGFGSRIFPKLNKCPISVGRNFKLDETLKLAVNKKNAVGMWGPYEIKKAAFDLAVKRKQLLDGGTIDYRADDRLTRKDRVAINCFHAMAGLEELYPNGGFLGTGLLRNSPADVCRNFQRALIKAAPSFAAQGAAEPWLTFDSPAALIYRSSSDCCRRLPRRLAALFLPIALAASGVNSRFRLSRIARARSEELNAFKTESTSIGLPQ